MTAVNGGPHTVSGVVTRAVVAVGRHAPFKDIVRRLFPDLVRAVDGTAVAFEADGFRAETRSGWSPIVTGRATAVTGPAEHERLARTGPASWTPLRETVFVRIEAETVTGREPRGTTAGQRAAAYGRRGSPRAVNGPPAAAGPGPGWR